MAGKMPIDVDDMKIDLASISSHKVRWWQWQRQRLLQ
jgi:cysteine sulfinate desulfinase/cysteine desulfurase-like protein